MDLIFQKFSYPSIDFFTTLENRKLEVFCSPYPLDAAYPSDVQSISLDSDVCLCVPSPNIKSPGPSESVPRKVYSSGSPTCSTLFMVSYPPRPANRLSKKITNNIKKVNLETGSNSALRSSKFKACTMENIQHSPSKESLSEKAQSYIKNSKRPSSRRMYEARQQIYICWCLE